MFGDEFPDERLIGPHERLGSLTAHGKHTERAVDGADGACSLADRGRDRFIEPLRTSPAANTAGTFVSNGSGDRPSDVQVPSRSSGVSWVSVRMNPRRSSATRASQAVAGSAPMKQNSPRQSRVSLFPVGPWVSVTRSRTCSPSTRVTSVATGRRSEDRRGSGRRGIGTSWRRGRDADRERRPPCQTTPETGSLSRRVRAAHHRQRLARASARFELGRGVVDPAPSNLSSRPAEASGSGRRSR